MRSPHITLVVERVRAENLHQSRVDFVAHNGVDLGDSQRQTVQGADRPHYGSRQYHRDRNRVLPLQVNAEETQGQKCGYEELGDRAAGRRREKVSGSV